LFRLEQRPVRQDEHAQADDRGIAPLDQRKARLAAQPHEGMQQDSGREERRDLQRGDANRQKRAPPQDVDRAEREQDAQLDAPDAILTTYA